MHMLIAALLALATFWLGLAAVPPPMAKVAMPPVQSAMAAPAADAPAAEIAPQPEPRQEPVIRTHTVADGESLSVIAERYGIDVETLLAANPAVGEVLQPGDELVILPGKGVLHVAAAGDTLWRLSRVYGVELAAIRTANGKTDDSLQEGEKLFIPGGRLSRGKEVSRSLGRRFVWPTAGELSSPFGYRWGRLHAGIDIASDTGTPVKAAAAGRVSFAGWWGGYGYAVVVEHGQGLSTLYGHLNGYAVAAGDYVAAAQYLGEVGETGNAYGPHLHFEVRRDGQAVNPLSFLP